MPRISLKEPHDLGREAAQRRLQEKVDEVYARFGSHVQDLQQRWDDHRLSFAFRVTGMGVRGTIAVEESAVALHADLPLPAMFFKNTIERIVREELARILA